MLDTKFKKIIDLNCNYSEKLSSWAEKSENLNDDALLKMLVNLMKEYDLQAELYFKKLKFEKEVYKKRRKFKEKSERTELSAELRKTKFQIKRKKKLNRKLYRLFKRKLKLEFKNQFLEKKVNIDTYCEKLLQDQLLIGQKPQTENVEETVSVETDSETPQNVERNETTQQAITDDDPRKPSTSG